MSRNAEEWEVAKNNAVRIRSYLHKAIEELEDWDLRFDDAAYDSRRHAWSEVSEAVSHVNALIGSLTIGGI